MPSRIKESLKNKGDVTRYYLIMNLESIIDVNFGYSLYFSTYWDIYLNKLNFKMAEVFE